MNILHNLLGYYMKLALEKYHYFGSSHFEANIYQSMNNKNQNNYHEVECIITIKYIFHTKTIKIFMINLKNKTKQFETLASINSEQQKTEYDIIMNSTCCKFKTCGHNSPTVYLTSLLGGLLLPVEETDLTKNVYPCPSVRLSIIKGPIPVVLTLVSLLSD